MYEYQCSTWFIPMITMVFVMFVVVNYGLVEESETRLRSLDLLGETRRLYGQEKYNTYVAPSNGVIKLSKGVGTVVHHSIKNDSVIVLSRKSLDGEGGMFLVIREIVPNERFVVEAVNGEGKVVGGDCGEVYFVIN